MGDSSSESKRCERTVSLTCASSAVKKRAISKSKVFGSGKAKASLLKCAKTGKSITIAMNGKSLTPITLNTDSRFRSTLLGKANSTANLSTKVKPGNKFVLDVVKFVQHLFKHINFKIQP